MPVILATQEAEFRRLMVQRVDHELKPYYQKKKKKKKKEYVS
jgi:hypothetical protein